MCTIESTMAKNKNQLVVTTTYVSSRSITKMKRYFRKLALLMLLSVWAQNQYRLLLFYLVYCVKLLRRISLLLHCLYHACEA